MVCRPIAHLNGGLHLFHLLYYASLFKGKWYDILQHIGIAKQSKVNKHASKNNKEFFCS